jgi:DNA polymerase III sliding clamp (beta) subunit (PCNA family)
MEFTIQGKDPQDYPKSPEFDTTYFPAISHSRYQDFTTQAKFIVSAVSCDMPQNYTSGVLFSYGLDSVRLIGTDGHRLHETTFGGTHEGTEDPESPKYLALVPGDIVNDLIKLGIKENPDMTFTFNGDYLRWEIDGIGFGTVRLMDTPYPDFENVIPETQHIFSVPVNPVLESLGPIGVIAKEPDGRDIIVCTLNGSFTIEAQSLDLGHVKSETPCDHVAYPSFLCGLIEVEGQDPEVSERVRNRRESLIESSPDGIKVAFNIDYFQDSIKLGLNSPDETVLMSGSGSLEPVKFWIEGSPQLVVLMPVRLPE